MEVTKCVPNQRALARELLGALRQFGLSRRQAYRYLELARAGRPAPPIAENSITITLKMPESLAGDLRAHASKHDLTTSEVIRRAVAAFLAAKRRHG